MFISSLMITMLISLPILIIIILIYNNRKLKSQNKKINEILAIKDTTISNYASSRVAVKDVIENFFAIDRVVTLIAQGKSREDIANELNISIERVEIIIKLSRLRDNYKSSKI